MLTDSFLLRAATKKPHASFLYQKSSLSRGKYQQLTHFHKVGLKSSERQECVCVCVCVQVYAVTTNKLEA